MIYLRLKLVSHVGALGYVLAAVLYGIGFGTDHWVNFSNAKTKDRRYGPIDATGHAGIWQECGIERDSSWWDNFTSSISPTATTTTTTVSWWDADKQDDQTPHPDDGNLNGTMWRLTGLDDCEFAGIADIPAYLHLARFLTIAGAIAIMFGLDFVIDLKRDVRNMFDGENKTKIIKTLIPVLGAALGLQGVENYFGSVHNNNERYPETSRSWSANTLEAGCYIMSFAVLFLYVPCLAKKFCGYRGSDADYLEHTRQVEMVDSRRSSLPNRDDPTPNYSDPAPAYLDLTPRLTPRSEGRAATIDNASDNSSISSSFNHNNDNGDIFTLTVNDDPSPNNPDPAPAYDDLSPRPEGRAVTPPPPSYDDVLAGAYHPNPGAPPPPSAPPNYDGYTTPSYGLEPGPPQPSCPPPPPPPPAGWRDSNA